MKFITLVIIVIATIQVRAQVSLQPIVPPLGVLQKSQLWNILAVNSTSEKYNCRLDLLLTDRQSNIEVLTASTGNFELLSGSKQLNANYFNPIQYNYISGVPNARLQDLLPVGNYTACYTLTSVGNKEFTLAEECVAFDVEALSAPLLITPADSSQLIVSPNQFTWTPPVPSEMFSQLSYQVIIAEVKDGQSSAQALQENIPFYTINDWQTNFLNYNNAYGAFEKGKWYTWQVIAKDNKSYAAKSDIATFKITSDAQKTTVAANYISLNKGMNGQGISHIRGRDLMIRYYCEGRDNKSSVSIYSTSGKLLQHEYKKVKYGDNFFQIKLTNGFSSDSIYLIEITGEDGKKYKTPFSLTL